MSCGQRKVDLKMLLQNLQDLNYVSDKIINEYQTKNNILKGGLQDCSACKSYLDGIKNKKKNNNNKV